MTSTTSLQASGMSPEEDEKTPKSLICSAISSETALESRSTSSPSVDSAQKFDNHIAEGESNNSSISSEQHSSEDSMEAYQKYIRPSGALQPLQQERDDVQVRSGRDHVQPDRSKYHAGQSALTKSLHELDQTVASVSKNHYCSSAPSPRRRRGEDDSLSISSHTIATQDAHSIHTQKNLIANMQHVVGRSTGSSTEGKSIEMQTNVSHHRRAGLSGSSRRSVSSRRSMRSRRKRGESLERTISQTILQTAHSSLDDAHFLISSDATSISETTLTEYILQDLVQANAVLESERVSPRGECDDSQKRARSQQYSAPPTSIYPSRFVNLLPPIQSESFVDDQESSLSRRPSVSQSISKSPNIVTPETSRDLNSALLGSFYTSSNSFNQLGHHDQFWTVPNQGESQKIISPFRREHTPAESISVQVSLDVSPLVDDGWTTFEDNPFQAFWSSKDGADTSSVASPSSIADFVSPNANLSKLCIPSRDSGWMTSWVVDTRASI